MPTEKEITAGVDLFYGYVSIDGQRALPPGFYRLRLALPGYEKSGAVKLSFIDAKGKSVQTLTGKGKPQRRKPVTDNANTTPTLRMGVCGRKLALRLPILSYPAESRMPLCNLGVSVPLLNPHR